MRNDKNIIETQQDAKSNLNGNAGVESKIEPVNDKKKALKAFDRITYFGIGGVVNSTLSLLITYNVLPTKFGQGVKTVLGKVISPGVGMYQDVKHSLLGKKNVAVSKALTEEIIHEQARSWAEVTCMIAAGFTVLPVMKWMEDHKAEVVDKLDRKLEKKKYAGMSEIEITKAQDDGVVYEKQKWGKLITSRCIALAACFGLDGLMQSWNTSRAAIGKNNFDTLEWSTGGKIYDALPKKATSSMVNFFSRKGQGISTIQPQVRERISNLVGHEAPKMVFSEQTRLLSKEVSLTALLASIVWAMAKTKTADSSVDVAGKSLADTSNAKIESKTAYTEEQPKSYAATVKKPTSKLDKRENFASGILNANAQRNIQQVAL